MIYNIEALKHSIQSGLQPDYLFFWGHKPNKDGTIHKSCFSQWWEAPFEVDNTRYLTAEHYMMAEKARLFNDVVLRAQIIASDTPASAKKLGRKIKNFDGIIWDQHKFDVVVAANVAKFSQHPLLKNYLLSTENKILVEASPDDKIWGIGMTGDDPRARHVSQWDGLNLLGFALMKVRALMQY